MLPKPRSEPLAPSHPRSVSHCPSQDKVERPLRKDAVLAEPDGHYQRFLGVARIASCKRCRYSLLGIETAPNCTKCGVVH